MTEKPLEKLFKKYIKNTKAQVIVGNAEILICNLTTDIKNIGSFPSLRVYANTRMLKHLYDKKPAEEFHFIVKNLDTIVSYPDHLYQNLNSKRGDFGIVKKIEGEFYFCSIEKSKNKNFVSTCFRLRKKKKENYLKSYKLLWSWKGDKPSS